jgi:hypothetical protein
VGDDEQGGENQGWKQWRQPWSERRARGLNAVVQTQGLTGGPDRFNYFLDFPKQLKLVNSKQICSIA